MSSKNVILLILLVVFCLLGCNDKLHLTQKDIDYLKKNQQLTAAVYIYYAPYEFLNENGEIDGILIDYFKLIEKQLDYKFNKKVYTNWDNLLSDAKNGKIDVILEIQETKKRKEYLNFTEPIFEGKHIIITQKDNNLKTLKSLNHKRVALGKGFSVEEYISTNYPKINIVSKPNEKDCLLALANGQVDAVIGLESVNNFIIKQSALNNLKIQGSIDYNYGLSIGINKNKPLLTSIINKANNTISQKSKKAITDKWLFNIEKPIYETIKFWVTLLGIMTIITLLIILWSYYLKKEVRKRTESLYKAKRTAVKNNELKTLFLQNISHEVRTPLNSIAGYTNFAEHTNGKLDELNVLLSESYSLKTILNNIIEISELNSKKNVIDKNTIALDTLLKPIVKTFSEKANLKGLNFNFKNNLNQEQNCITTDQLKLNTAIVNILDNAIKFTNQGYVAMEIYSKDNLLHIKISDSGLGIPKSELKLIFNEFYQVEKNLAKKYDGLGIGLSIANKNIKSLGGSIITQIKDKGGLVQTISIPVNFVPCNQKYYKAN